jgi:hypothetical protein
MKRNHALAELESPQHQKHQRHEWWFERVGWVLMLLVIVAALLGFIGPGPLTSREVAGGEGSPTIEYYVVEHYGAPGRFVVRAPPGRRETLQLTVSRSFCDRATAESIVPPPASVAADDDDVTYTFALAGAEPTIVFRYKYDEFGVFDHQIAVDGGRPVAFRQYVLP